MKVTLTAAQLAAFAAGATLESMGLVAENVANMPGPVAPVLVAPEIHAAIVGERDAFKATVTTVTAERDSLQLQLTALQGVSIADKSSLSTSQAAIVGLTTERDTLKATNEKMLPVLQSDVAVLRVALGGVSVGADTLDVPAALAEHTKLSADFLARFPGGRLAKPVVPKVESAGGPSMAYLDLIPSGPKAKQ